MPMVTLVKTFDVTRLVKVCKRDKLKFNMLLCWCIARAASQSEVFYLLPVGGRLMQYESMGVNVIVTNKEGGINLCDVPFDNDFKQFAEAYETLTAQCAYECKDIAETQLEESAVCRFLDELRNIEALPGAVGSAPLEGI